jgi:oligoribonuclease (3'-5' exoribonuclease)
MNDWCKEHHAKSGLVQRVRDSSVSIAQAEAAVLAFVQEHTEYQAAQLAGNSVHVDRLFLQRHMPALLEHMHYRIVDVSTFKECCRCGCRLGFACVVRHALMSGTCHSNSEMILLQWPVCGANRRCAWAHRCAY